MDDLVASEDTEHGEALARLFQQLEKEPLTDESRIHDPAPEETRA